MADRKRSLCATVVLTSLFIVWLYGCEEASSGSRCVRLAQNGKLWDLKHLLDRREVPIDIRGDEGGTALHWACRSGHEAVVRLLLARGAEIAARCTLGATPLHWAAYAGRDTIVQILLAAGWYAAPSLVHLRDNCGLTPLHWVVKNGNRRSLHLLLNHGADIYAEDSKTWTPFIQALDVGQEGMLKELIRRGFKNRRNSRGRTPLNELVQQGFVSIVRFWLAYGVDVTLKDRLGRNVLHQAAHYGCADLVAFLARKTTLDLDVKSRLGTPLHLAIAKGRQDVVKVLLRYGACFDIQNHIGHTPLRVVVRQTFVGYPRYRKRAQQILHDMLDFGVRIDTKTEDMLVQYGGAQYFTGCQYEEVTRKMVCFYIFWINTLGGKYQTVVPIDICRLIALFMVTASDEE